MEHERLQRVSGNACSEKLCAHERSVRVCCKQGSVTHAQKLCLLHEVGGRHNDAQLCDYIGSRLAIQLMQPLPSCASNVLSKSACKGQFNLQLRCACVSP